MDDDLCRHEIPPRSIPKCTFCRKIGSLLEGDMWIFDRGRLPLSKIKSNIAAKRRLPIMVVRASSIVLGLAGGFGAAVSMQIGLSMVERSMVYHPAQAGDWREVAPPSPWRRVAILDAATGVDVFAWHRLAQAGLPTTLWLHGNADSPAGLRPVAESLSENGSGALLLSYRGYAGNPGSPNEAGLISDAAAALAWLRSEGAGDIIVAGHSLGTGVAAGLAALAEDAGAPVSGLVLFAPFTDLPAVASRQLPFLPVRMLMAERYDTLGRVAALPDLPVLILHGALDEVVPVEEGRKLAAALGTRATLVILDQEGHAPFSAQAMAAAAAFLEARFP
jgi:uncharacterized protein